MKKHKVEIPEGYGPGTLEYDTYLDNDGNKHYIAARLTLIPSKKEFPKTWEEYKCNDRKAIMKIGMKNKIICAREPTKKQLPKTWEEYCKNNELFLTWDNNINIPMNREPEFRALLRLVELRDHYNDGWKPDWNCDNKKPSIQVWNNKVLSIYLLNQQSLLVFKTEELRDKFLSNFRDLIETAKPLL